MAQNPVFTDVDAYGRAVPGAVQPVSAAPAAEAAGNIGDAAMKLATVYRQQDQDQAVLGARIKMGDEFAKLRQQVSEETDFVKAQEIFDTESARIKEGVDGAAIDGLSKMRIGASYAENYQHAQADAYLQINKRRNATFLATAEQRSEQIHHDVVFDPDIKLEAKKSEFGEMRDAFIRDGTMYQDKAQEWYKGKVSESDDILATSWVKNDPRMALERLTATGKKEDGKEGWRDVVDLSEKRREGLIEQAKSGGRKDAANVGRLHEQGLANIWDGTGDGGAQTKEAYARGMEGNVAQNFEGDIKAARDAKTYLDRARYLPIGEMTGVVREFQEQASKPGNEYLGRAGAELAKRVEELRQEWISKPAETADREYSLGEKPGGKPWTLAELVDNRLNAMDAKGVSNQPDTNGIPARLRVLRQNEVAGYVSSLQNAPAMEKRNVMKAIQDDLGPYAGVAIAQMRRDGKLPGQYVLISDPNINPTGVQALSQTAGAKLADLAKGLPDPTNNRKAIETQVRQDFTSGIGRTFANRDDYTDFMEATVAVAMDYGRSDPGGASSRAMKDLWGNMKVTGTSGGQGTVRLPHGITPDQKQRVDYALADATTNVERFKPVLGATPLGEYRRRIQNEGQWFTYQGEGGKDEGVYLSWMGVAQTNSDGAAIRMTFAEMYQTKIPTAAERDEQQARALADPRTRLRYSALGNLPPTPGAR